MQPVLAVEGHPLGYTSAAHCADASRTFSSLTRRCPPPPPPPSQNGQVKTAAAPSQGSSSKKKTKKGGELSADALEAQLLASNGGEALTHSQQRQLKKLRKKEKQVQQQSAG
jgi:hypothetical protein